MKVLKPNHQYHLTSIVYKPLFLKQYKYLANTHLEKRHMSVLHARIRNNCSNLNTDLFNNHLRDNPLCIWCYEIEDGEHYFFHCYKYRNERHQFFELARDFQPLTINMLLYFNETLDYQLNTELFSAVHGYIKNTKRFDNT